jgi:hypothetical protein
MGTEAELFAARLREAGNDERKLRALARELDACTGPGSGV